MPNLIEDRLSSLLAEWMTSHRPAEIPESGPFHVARRDDIRTRPCVVLNPTESKPIPGMPHTARVKLTTPDESRGRETVLSYEAVVSAV